MRSRNNSLDSTTSSRSRSRSWSYGSIESIKLELEIEEATPRVCKRRVRERNVEDRRPTPSVQYWKLIMNRLNKLAK